MLKLKLLGSPQLLLNDRPVTGLSAPKHQALLFYLALSRRPQSRLALAGLLWPEKRDAEALANLRQAVYHLRNALPNYLVINRLTLAINRAQPCQIDVVFFEKAFSATHPIPEHQAAAVDHYTGEFLAGFYVEEAPPFEEWAVIMRERLHHLAITALHGLVTHFVEHQEPEPGLRYTNQLLALEPWLEEAHCQKMRLLAWDGQRQAALEQYAQCRQILAEELGVEPAAETVALYEQIRAGNLQITHPKGIGNLRNDGKLPVSSPTEAAQEKKDGGDRQTLVNRQSKIRMIGAKRPRLAPCMVGRQNWLC